jgi:CelD/BcsL family acetyltransferase involved in cellulose biosynthesis
MLNAWLREWWRWRSGDAEVAIPAAFRDGRLVAALPVCVGRSAGLRVARMMGGDEAALGDLLLRQGEAAGTGTRLLAEVRAHYADLFGLAAGSRLGGELRLVERVEAPVLDMSRGWQAVYRDKTTGKKRSLHRRRRRQLGELGELEVRVARSADELGPALEEAFALHRLRWRGRPDHSGFASPDGVRFHHAAFAALAPRGVPRIVTLRLDGRAIAFHSYLAYRGTMYVHRLAFDPELGRLSPGLVNTLDALEAASAEGLERVEFLGGAERYKLELADRLEPLHQGLGLARGPRGHAAVAARLAAIRLRGRARRSPSLRRAYMALPRRRNAA